MIEGAMEAAGHIGHVVEKSFNPEAIRDVGKHVATALTVELDGLNADGLSLGDVDHGLVLDADSLANGTESVQEKTESLTKARMARASHQHYKHALRVMRMMLWISVKNKAVIIALALGVSLAVPTWVFVTAAPIFMGFGFWMGREAREANAKAREEYKNRHAHAAQPKQKAHRLRTILEEMKWKDRYATSEMMIAVVGSIFHLPIIEQLVVMSVYAVGMTVGVYLFTTGLIKAEDLGERLESWKPKNPLENPAPKTMLGRALQKTPLPGLVGRSLDVPSRIGGRVKKAGAATLHAMPVVAAGAKYVTSGRVINHASPHHVEPFTERLAHLPAALPYVGHFIGGGFVGGLTEFAATMIIWGGTGIAAGFVADKGYLWVYKPLSKEASKHIPVDRLKKDFRALATGMALRIGVGTAPAPARDAATPSVRERPTIVLPGQDITPDSSSLVPGHQVPANPAPANPGVPKPPDAAAHPGPQEHAESLPQRQQIPAAHPSRNPLLLTPRRIPRPPFH